MYIYTMTTARRPSDIQSSNINIGQLLRKSVMDGDTKLSPSWEQPQNKFLTRTLEKSITTSP